MYEKIIVITRKTRLQELVSRFNTKAQAKFYIEHSGGDYADYEKEDQAYSRSLDVIHKSLDVGLKLQFVDREFLPNFLFTESDVVVALGQDGLIANAAKYVKGQPLIGVNPDPERFDGILVPVLVSDSHRVMESLLQGQATINQVTLAEAALQDGQRLLAFNDLFIGAKSHISARYQIQFSGRVEAHSSSGLIVSTGAGSTGWLSSVFNMVSSVSVTMGGAPVQPVRMNWQSEELLFVAREPFQSKHSSANIVFGRIEPGQELVIESRMPTGGTIFSDGVETDFLSFNSGATAKIRAAAQKANLVMPTPRDVAAKSKQIVVGLRELFSS